MNNYIVISHVWIATSWIIGFSNLWLMIISLCLAMIFLLLGFFEHKDNKRLFEYDGEK